MTGQTTDALRLTCAACGQANRVPRERLSGGPKCGSCGEALADGRVQQSNFHDQPLLRLNEAPAIETVIVPSIEHPEGVGEPGVPPIAPAVANALFALTGQRLRSLPLKPA